MSDVRVEGRNGVPSRGGTIGVAGVIGTSF